MTPRIPLPWRAARRRIVQDVDEELLGHIELKARDLEREGLTPEDALAQANSAFGGTEAIGLDCAVIQRQIDRRKRRSMGIDEIRNDLRWAVRSLLRARGFAVFAILTLALGIAANTSIFSVANGIFLRSLPGVRNPNTLVDVMRGPGFVSISHPMYEHFRDNGVALDDLAAFDVVGVSLGDEHAAPEVVMGLQVSGNYFDVLGTRPAEGRFFLGSERSIAPGPSVAVLSHHIWLRRFDGDPGVVGSTIRVNGESVTVIGVAEEGFSGHMAAARVQVFMPLGSAVPGFHSAASLDNVFSGVLELVGRVTDGADIGVIGAQLSQLGQSRLIEEDPARAQSQYLANVRKYSPVPGTVRGPAGIFFVILSVVVGLLLLISCLNVAGLLISRSAGRRREMAIRLSLGAARGRVVRQLMTESLVLALLAGALGVMLTYWITGALSAFQLPIAPLPGLSLDLHLTPDGGVLLYSFVLVVGTGILFGLTPALRATRADLVTDLKGEGGLAAPGRNRLQSTLVAAQMAATILLLTVSGLFLRALVSAETLDTGFDTTDVHLASFDLELAGRSSEGSSAFYSELRRRTLEFAGVLDATVAGKLPLAGLSQMAPVNFEGVEPPEGTSGFTLANQSVGPGYFSTLGIQLVRGRGFQDRDDASAPNVTVVNEALANRMWPGESALGRRVTLGDGSLYEVVGVAATIKYSRLNELPRNFAYFPAAQRPRTDMILHLKTAPGGSPPMLQIREAASALEPAAALLSATSLDAAVGIFLLPQRVGVWVTGVVGAFGLLLGGIGVYALTAYWVTTNTRELGIRMAMGASRREVLLGVLRRGLAAPAVGAIFGLVVALAGSRFLEAFLFGVDPLDPLTFGGVVAILGSISFVANLVPAVRATRLDPVRALRAE
jgi:predicted permease